MLKTLYHTIRKGYNVKASVKNAPYPCVDEPWFGRGYYFWDGSEELAEWWGETHYNGDYIITKVDIDFPNGSLLDLIDNMQHLQFFRAAAETLTMRLREEATVPKTVEEIRKRKDNPFIAVRGMCVPFYTNPYDTNNTYYSHIRIADKVKFYLDVLPRHQICIFDKKNIPPLQLVRTS